MVTNNRRMGSFVHCVRIQYRIIRVKKQRVFKTNVVASEPGRAAERVGAAEKKAGTMESCVPPPARPGCECGA